MIDSEFFEKRSETCENLFRHNQGDTQNYLKISNNFISSAGIFIEKLSDSCRTILSSFQNGKDNFDQVDGNLDNCYYTTLLFAERSSRYRIGTISTKILDESYTHYTESSEPQYTTNNNYKLNIKVEELRKLTNKDKLCQTNNHKRISEFYCEEFGVNENPLRFNKCGTSLLALKTQILIFEHPSAFWSPNIPKIVPLKSCTAISENMCDWPIQSDIVKNIHDLTTFSQNCSRLLGSPEFTEFTGQANYRLQESRRTPSIRKTPSFAVDNTSTASSDVPSCSNSATPSISSKPKRSDSYILKSPPLCTPKLPKFNQNVAVDASPAKSVPLSEPSSVISSEAAPSIIRRASRSKNKTSVDVDPFLALIPIDVSETNSNNSNNVIFLYKVKTLYNYKGDSTSELTFSPDQIIHVIEENENGWNFGCLNGTNGFFPVNFVSRI